MNRAVPIFCFLFCLALLIQLATVAAADEPKTNATALPPVADVTVDFEQHVRPIFATRCISCHGPDEAMSDLRLDLKSRAMAGGSRGGVVVPGKSEQSLLVQFVAGLDPDLTMPPDGEPLSAEEIGILRAWIDQGATWPDESNEPPGSSHWSFQPIVQPTPPAVQQSAWIRNPIDAFVLARLEEEGVLPSPEASRATLVRRLYLDLIGLLPTPDEVDEFVLDNGDDAYERLVDRLLASPHYGERWGRHWLDLARYADSDGYEKDSPRPYAWRYRDWVIQALNRDLPFDQFTIEQLAGDLLPDATTEQIVATGFHRNSLTNREGGVDQEEYRSKANVDRVHTTGTVWLGLTLGCAECHSHKYDPISHREFYGMFAFFDRTEDKDISAPLPDELAAYEQAKAEYDAEHARRVAAVEAHEREHLAERLAAWEATFEQPSPVDWRVLASHELKSDKGATLEAQPDGSILASGKNPSTDTYQLALRTDLPRVTAVRLEVLPDASLPSNGPGRVKHGNFVLSSLHVTAAPVGDPSARQSLVLRHPTATHAQTNWDVALAIDDDNKTGWAIQPQIGRRNVAVFELSEPVSFDGGVELRFTLEQNYGRQHTIGRLRLSATSDEPPVSADGHSEELLAALAIPRESRSEEQQALVVSHFRQLDPELSQLDAAVVEHTAQEPQYPETKARTLAANAEPPQTHIHLRGDFLQKGAPVDPHTPAVLPPLQVAGEQPTRLDLARWLVDRDNPLTSRVVVNRIWRHYFGQGLVASVNDFGTQGETPSHPALLDWLASEFPARDWSLKAMHRLIVTSATYRQSSHVRPELEQRDPKNVWLARQNRFRVEAEIVRDLHLAASGLLNRQIGGPSVRPALPSGVAELGYANSVKWPESEGADRYRRGTYIFFQRTVPYPMLTTFDAPDANVTCTAREVSNTPLQALTLLNDPTLFECAQGLARRIASEAPSADPADRVRFAYKLCLARDPGPRERQRVESLYDEVLALCQSQPESAAELAGDDLSSVEATPAELAAWVVVGRMLMNLDEFATRE